MKTKMKRIELLCIAFLLLSACTTQNLQSVRLEELSKVVEISKSPCAGYCPVFTMTIYKGGIVSYKGERFTEKNGLYVKKLSAAEMETIVAEFSKSNLWQFKNAYRSEFYDTQTVSITYWEEGDNKSIIGKDNRPQKVLELEKMLDGIANADGWEQRGKSDDNYGLPQEFIVDQLIVQLKPGIDTKRWARKYYLQEMELLESIASDSNYWLFVFNPKNKHPQAMLDMVRNDSDVINVEFNKRLSLRE